MAITISGSGITSANIADGTIVNADVADVAASKLTGALPAIDGSALTGVGKVLQVVSSTNNGNSYTSSTSFVATGDSVTITPKSSTSKMLVVFNSSAHINATAVSPTEGYVTIFRDNTTNIGDASTGIVFIRGQNGYNEYPTSLAAVDSPNTLSSTTYSAYIRVKAGTSVGWSFTTALRVAYVLEIEQ